MEYHIYKGNNVFIKATQVKFPENPQQQKSKPDKIRRRGSVQQRGPATWRP